MAIAQNYRKHADALIRQLELDFSGVVSVAEQSAAAWAWLMAAGKPQPLARPAAPTWLKDARRAAAALAATVKRRLLCLFY